MLQVPPLLQGLLSHGCEFSAIGLLSSWKACRPAKIALVVEEERSRTLAVPDPTDKNA